MKTLITLSSTLALSLAACGTNHQKSGSIRDIASGLKSLADITDYQIGPSWGKQPVTKDSLAGATDVFKCAARATARVSLGFSGGATAFVIGEKNGETILATNHHVIEDDGVCSTAKISFELLGISGLRCKKVIVTNTDLDLTIFTVSGLSPGQKSDLAAVARGFSADESRKGTQLLTIGYGVAGNSGQRNLMAGQDDDCKTFSPDGEVRFMADPDELNPGPYKTWMFATGCDVSHGDSGSAIVDRSTGDVVGILSTGKIPKSKIVRDSKFLSKIFDTNSESVWSELTYVVPSAKIVDIVGNDLP